MTPSAPVQPLLPTAPDTAAVPAAPPDGTHQGTPHSTPIGTSGSASHPPDALAGLLSRYSLGIKHLTEPGPDDAALRWMAETALHAPDHAGLVPFRFKVVRGAARQRLAELFVEVAGQAGKTPEAAQIEAERALRAPVTLAVLARIDLGHPLVPAHEQWVALGGALANLLNAAHLLGYAGKMLSGAKVRQPLVQAAFCAPGETLVGWVALGTALRAPAPGHAKAGAAEVLSEWSGPLA